MAHPQFGVSESDLRFFDDWLSRAPLAEQEVFIETIRLPNRWQDEGLKTWTEALQKCPTKVHVILSKDRSST
jgi:hypothetical protein